MKPLKFCPAGPFALCCRLNVYRSALFLRNLPCPEKFLVTRLLCQGHNISSSFKVFVSMKKNFANYHYSLFFLYNKSQTDWQKLLVEFSTFVRLDECGLIWPHSRRVMWQIFNSDWNFVFENMTCHIDKITIVEASRHINFINVFHDVDSIF